VTVLDGVGDSFSGGDKDIQTLIGVYPCSRQPAAQGVAGRARLLTSLNFSSSGRDGGRAKNNVVLITAAWRETRHHLVRQIVQRRDAAVLNEVAAREMPSSSAYGDARPAIGVEQHGRARRHLTCASGGASAVVS